jgi:hypothetical protein
VVWIYADASWLLLLLLGKHWDYACAAALSFAAAVRTCTWWFAWTVEDANVTLHKCKYGKIPLPIWLSAVGAPLADISSSELGGEGCVIPGT